MTASAGAPPDGAVSLVAYLEAGARVHPDAVAVVDPDGTPLTYGTLEEQANRIAGLLIEHGVEPGDRVGVIAPKSARVIAAMFGIMKARAAYVPADYTAPAARNQTILADAEVRAAFLDASCESLADGLPTATVVVALNGAGAAAPGAPPHVSWDDAVATRATPLPPGRSLDDLAYILYTSGSTGTPKGVMLTHGNATSFVDWCSSVFHPTGSDRFSSHAPFHFDLSVLDIYVALKHGAELHIVSEALGKEPRELARFIAQRRLTVWYSTPSVLTLLADYGHLRTEDYGALRLVLFAGEVFPVKHLRHITALLPHAEYFNLYGPTETNVCTYARIPLPVPAERDTPYPIGWACSHCRALVLDGEGHEVPDGEEGLLYIAGPSVFRGYRNRPEHDATAFIHRDGERWYNTGDVVRLDPADGYIYVGRRDRMVKRRGYRIELGEVERGLYQHPQSAEAAVVASHSDTGVRLVAFVALKPGPRPSLIELKSFSAQVLPSYMSPDQFLFVEALPRTSTNKVDYQRLTRMATGQA